MQESAEAAELSQALRQHLMRAASAFADQTGDIAVIIQSKSDPDLSIAVNAEKPMPSASLIKAAIACAAAQGEVDLKTPVAISALDDTFYCSIIQAFESDDQITLRALIGLMLIVSDNPATTAVLDAIGMDKVNAWLGANGLKDTNLAIGFDDNALGSPLRANLTSAADCLRLLQMIDREPAYGFVKHMLANNLRNERIPKNLPDDAVIAHKTGTLNGLCHDIAMIESPQSAYYLIILADGLPDGHDFAGEMARFSAEIYALMSA